jgi:hypothetical protein
MRARGARYIIAPFRAGARRGDRYFFLEPSLAAETRLGRRTALT